MTDSLPPTPAVLPLVPTEPTPGGAPPAGTELPEPPPAVGTVGWWRQPLFWLTFLALLLVAWQWTETRHRLLVTQEEVAKRLAEQDALAREARLIAKQAQDTAMAMQTRLAVVESRLAEFQSQQTALEGLYQELARGRDEWTLAEVEQIIGLAAQQLQLAGNVQAAVLALSNADARLARVDRPQFLALRKTISRDLGRLRSMPLVDVAGISVKIEAVVTATDGLALAFEERPRGEVKKVAPIEAAPAVAATPASPLAAFDAWWNRLGGEVWQEARSLVRIERFDRPEPALLAPTQVFFLRENLKLRLLNARLALLARDQTTFRGELKQAIAWLERHFDGRDKKVQAVLASLRPLAAADVAVELPNLNDSLSALRTVRFGRGGKDGAP